MQIMQFAAFAAFAENIAAFLHCWFVKNMAKKTPFFGVSNQTFF